MSSEVNIADTQARILRTLTVLHTLRQDWGGSLILCCGLGPQGAALALASNIAGAVCLNIEEEPSILRDAMRSGSCDFIINTLDEALRAMKNEARKHLPLSVGLQGNPAQVLDEILERGVSPQLVTDTTNGPTHAAARRKLQSLGALVIDFDGRPTLEGTLDANTLLGTFLHQQQWQLRTVTFNTSSALRTFDARALSSLQEGDQLRRRWLQAAPRILQRERPIHRVLWLTDQEEKHLQTETVPEA
jgi:Urocanase Rossmann-like domain